MGDGNVTFYQGATLIRWRLKSLWCVILLLSLLGRVTGGGTLARAATGPATESDRAVFNKEIDIERLRLLGIMHRDQLKIMESWARQSMEAVTYRQKYAGQDPLFTALDMTFRPEAWLERKIIYVRDVPLRKELAQLEPDDNERQRIMSKGTMSPKYLLSPEAQQMLQQVSTDAILGKSAERVWLALGTYQSMFDTLLLVPPAPGRNQDPWHHPAELRGNFPRATGMMGGATQAAGESLPPPLPGYDTTTAGKIHLGLQELAVGWRTNDVRRANAGIRLLAENLPTVNPRVYPSDFKRKVELIYDRSFNGTLVAFIYGTAFTLFMIATFGKVKRMHKWAVGFFIVAVFCHFLATETRWYLAGRIPIQNEFESVLGAAFFGCLLGLGLEMWKKNGLFGMATSFVGFAAMTACFVFPFMLGKSQMGANIGTVSGILDHNIWLYIHVNIIIWSYALIGASFMLGVVYLLIYFKTAWAYNRQLPEGSTPPALVVSGVNWLRQVDAANVVILQLAFWLLGTGIVCGAVWADVSWGRPWGWDPKETFALVTWIVYLIIVHMRFITGNQKAFWTAVLSIIGFAIMLFNWVGVNYFLVGLHSYA